MRSSQQTNSGSLRDQYYRAMFVAAAAWNAIAGAAFLVLLRYGKLRLNLGFPPPADPIASQLLACCLFVFGLGYYWVSRDLAKNHDIVKLGVAGKPLVFAVFLWHAMTKEIPMTLVFPSLVDLLFGVLFLEFLLRRRDGSLYAESSQ